MRDSGTLSLAGAPIVLHEPEAGLLRRASEEIPHFLHALTGRESPVVGALPKHRTAVVLELDTSAAPRDEGFEIRTGDGGRPGVVSITAATGHGVLWGGYALLETLGVGFHLGGETFPDRKTEARLPSNFHLRERPSFAVRGNLLHDNCLVGVTTWGPGDFCAYFDRLARLRCNLFALVSYENAYDPMHVRGARSGDVPPVMSSLTRPWGALASLRTSEFFYGTGEAFENEIYSSPAGETITDPVEQRRETCRVFREAIRHARRVGLGVAAGLIAPWGNVNNPADPTDPRVAAAFRERVRAHLEQYPDLTHFVLTNHEAGGCSGTRPPASGEAGRLFEARRELFTDLGNDWRRWEAIRFLRFAELAHAVLQQTAPELRLVLSGWGGDNWMRFADLFPAYDRLLPRDVFFTCHENVDAAWATTVSEPYGRLPADRERWAVPWIEGDVSDLWTPHANVETLAALAPDALAKGCQGFLTMHWRARDCEEEAGYAARFAWDTSLTPERFYGRMARDAFGEDQATRMAGHLLALQRLGRGWSGVAGTPEVGEMIFTGTRPHIPFELGPDAVRFLLPFARNARKRLGDRAPPGSGESFRPEDVALFHQVFQADGAETDPDDPNGPGVVEFGEIIRQLESLQSDQDPERLRKALARIEESVFELRPGLIRHGMTAPQFSAVDLFLLRLHHLVQRGGVEARMETLRQIRDDLDRLRAQFVNQGRTGRLERLDYLAATMDFVMHYARVAMLLADGEEVEQALERAEGLARAGKPREAFEVADAAYRRLMAAGMEKALRALTRKLVDRDAFAVLATVNIKPMPLYREFVERLEALRPTAGPPR